MFGPLRELRAARQALGQSLDATWEVTKAIVDSLGRLVHRRGPRRGLERVGIVQISSAVARRGLRYYLGVLALISLSLALLNLLPLLPLDGGHIAFSLAERIRGRAIPREAYERVSMIGIALVLLPLLHRPHRTTSTGSVVARETTAGR